MASNRKKQDDKILKILRDLGSLPCNKFCFDCKQRGPTYVNTTIGSFVCTRCSGLLRGITPPHRVKSISMATFTQDEIDFLKARGNEYCRKVWLALYDSNQVQDTKDEQNVRDFMVAKYERKRYYQELSNGVGERTVAHIPSPLSSPQAVTSPVLARPSVPHVTQSPSMNLKAVGNMLTASAPSSSAFAFPQVADPFGQATSNTAQPSFADFDNNPAFFSPPIPPLPASSSFPSGLKSAGRQPAEDKYAALKDLDSLMKQQQIQQQEPVAPQPTYVNNSFSGGVSDWRNGPANPVQSANPFATAFGCPVSFSSDGMNPNPSNPFRNGFEADNNSSWANIPASHSMFIPVGWATQNNLTVGPSNSGNPFL